MTTHMTYHDYERMANDYRSQADVIKQKLKDECAKKHFDTIWERKQHEERVRMLREMYNDCTSGYGYLLKISERIKERESNG